MVVTVKKAKKVAKQVKRKGAVSRVGTPLRRTIKGKPANKRPTLIYGRGVPDEKTLLSIPAAQAGVFEMTDKEVQKTRSRLYAINRDNAAGWKYRTVREFPLLLVVRIH